MRLLAVAVLAVLAASALATERIGMEGMARARETTYLRNLRAAYSGLAAPAAPGPARFAEVAVSLSAPEEKGTPLTPAELKKREKEVEQLQEDLNEREEKVVEKEKTIEKKMNQVKAIHDWETRLNDKEAELVKREAAIELREMAIGSAGGVIPPITSKKPSAAPKAQQAAAAAAAPVAALAKAAAKGKAAAAALTAAKAVAAKSAAPAALAGPTAAKSGAGSAAGAGPKAAAAKGAKKGATGATGGATAGATGGTGATGATGATGTTAAPVTTAAPTTTTAAPVTTTTTAAPVTTTTPAPAKPTALPVLAADGHMPDFIDLIKSLDLKTDVYMLKKDTVDVFAKVLPMEQARSVIDDCSAVLIDQANYERIKASVDKMPHEHPVPAWHDTVHFAASHDKLKVRVGAKALANFKSRADSDFGRTEWDKLRKAANSPKEDCKKEGGKGSEDAAPKPALDLDTVGHPKINFDKIVDKFNVEWKKSEAKKKQHHTALNAEENEEANKSPPTQVL